LFVEIDPILLLPSRKYLRHFILPFLVGHQPVIDVGFRYYNKHHRGYFEKYVSVDVDPIRQADLIADVTLPSFVTRARACHANYGSVLFNGMIGYGVNNVSERQAAFANSFTLLDIGGILVVGWNETHLPRNQLFAELARSFNFVSFYETPNDPENHNYTTWQK
jgi:cellulase/cellobiase CelA1